MNIRVLVGFLVAATLVAAPLGAQTITSPPEGSTVQIESAKDYATWIFQDPWDMTQRTDLGWFTFAADQPSANLSSWSFAGGLFSAVPRPGVSSDPTYADPNFWLLDTFTPGAATVGRHGKNHPIDTATYRILMLRMRLTGLPSTDSKGPHAAQVIWSNNTIYPDQPNGGVRSSNGIPVQEGWWVYYIDLTTVGGSPGWTAHATVDSLRFDPVQYLASSFDVDWVRLTNLDQALNRNITWTGGGTYDVFLSTVSDCSNSSKIGSATPSPFSFYVGGLPPGDYYVGLGSVGSSTATRCSTGRFRVLGVPTAAFTSPGDEGSADDFATVQLNDAWDMASTGDIDYQSNITSLGVTAIPAENEAGADLGSIQVLAGTSTAGTPATGNVGDPWLFPMYLTKRGLDYRIDADRYRVLTLEMGVNHDRDLAGGSVARLFWHVAGEQDAQGALLNETADIVLRHLGTSNVLQRITLDMAAVEGETDPGRRSNSGWVNGSTANPGIDAFRVDPHEFAAPTSFFIRRIKLAAFERASSTYAIKWSFTNPTSRPGTTVSFYYDTEGSGFGGTAVAGCQNVDPMTGSTGCAWDMSSAGLIPGTAYYIHVQIKFGSTLLNRAYARWPVVYDPSYVANQPRIVLDRATLRHSAVKTGCMLTSVTPSQDVRLAQTGGGSAPWTVTSSAPWLQVSPTGGEGTGGFTVNLVDWGGGCGNLPATTVVDGLGAVIKVEAPGVSNSPQYVHHYTTVYSPGSTTGPFGQVDTPTQNAAGVQGAIGVTGWMLDDVAVADVSIYRTCLAFDDPAACQLVGGVNVVYVGTAAFLPGARPDVEAAFPRHPQAYRAGWGFLMLTNMLPDVTNAQPYGGQGSLALYVFANDREGHRTLVGRSQVDHTPTTITMENASIAKPFGAIDTPGQGQTVSGTMPNFGWALTPDSDMTVGNGDIEIPPNGSTMVVFLDGAATGQVTYNQCRGTVGNPVPAGDYCNDDVANVFGNPAPQPTFTTRSGNPTKYRNLDASRAAIGSFDIDTTALANGLHTIAWSVTDSASRVEGIGSRFFIAFNGSGDPAVTADVLRHLPARVVGDTADVAWRPLADGAVWGRTGYDLRTPWERVAPETDGSRHVQIPELGRLELYLGPGVTTGYLSANGSLRSLPPGSRLVDGHLTWGPGAGYVGQYDLVFLSGIARIPVTVTIRAAGGTGAIRASIDEPRAGVSVGGSFQVAGWAADPAAWAGTGIGAVHVWAHRRDVTGLAPVFLGAAELGAWRPDVGTALGAQFERAGWQLTAQALPPGEFDVVAYLWSLRTGRFEDARAVSIRVR